MTDIVVILNPAAGNRETVHDWQERVESIVGRWPVRVTSHAGDAEALARRAVEEGFGRVVAAGGDGTVNQVANGIAGSNAALGILPMGTINVFAMELGLPANDLERRSVELARVEVCQVERLGIDIGEHRRRPA